MMTLLPNSDTRTTTSILTDEPTTNDDREHVMGRPLASLLFHGASLPDVTASPSKLMKKGRESRTRDALVTDMDWFTHARGLIAFDLSRGMYSLLGSNPYPTTADKSPNPWRGALKTKVYNLLEEAGVDNWDGQDALALDYETVIVAQKLVDEFPTDIEEPDVAATPHGEVDFDWVISSDVMLTVSVGPSNEVSFAGLFHGAQLNGREPWKGTLPQFVHCCFERLHDS